MTTNRAGLRLTGCAVVLRWCATCLDETMFDQPECADRHGGDCPEWVCVTCGDALLLGFAPLQPAHDGRASRTGRAGRRRRVVA